MKKPTRRIGANNMPESQNDELEPRVLWVGAVLGGGILTILVLAARVALQ